jgi:hypothetical protein
MTDETKLVQLAGRVFHEVFGPTPCATSLKRLTKRARQSLEAQAALKEIVTRVFHRIFGLNR